MKTRRFSITDKLIIASFFLSGVIIFIVASYSYHSARLAVIDRAFDQLNSVRVVKTNLIETFFASCIEDVKLAQSSIEVKQLIEHLNAIPSKPKSIVSRASSIAKQTPFLKQLSKEIYGNIYLVSKNNQILPIKLDTLCIKWPDIYNLWNDTINKDSIYIEDYGECNNHQHLHLNLSSPIHDNRNRIVGFIVFEILPSSIDSIMLNGQINNGLGETGESYLVGSDFYMRSSSRFQANSIMNTKVETEATVSAFNHRFGDKMIKDYRNILVLSSYNLINIAKLHWVILAEIDYKEVLIPVDKIRSEIVFVSIFIFLIVIVVVIVLSKRITVPIVNLNHAVQRVGEGDFEGQLNSNSDDEIGELTDTFNNMILKLKEQSVELEKERENSLRSLIDGQERERQRLSRELHDSLGQILIALKLKYESCINKSGIKSESFTDLRLLFDQTIEETRRISNNIMPSSLSEFGLTTSVRNICNELSNLSEIQFFLDVKGSGSHLSDQTKIYLFRIIQEGLSNIIKHSMAKKAVIKLGFEEKHIFVTIKDDGKGFNQQIPRNSKSNGINNIFDRVSLLSGEITIDTSENQGTEIQIIVPVK